MLCCYGYGQQQSATTKNAGKLLPISIDMAMQRYDVGHIIQ
jgi:hypothetical protein